MLTSLLDASIPCADGPDEPLSDYSASITVNAKCEVVFRDHKRKILEFISRYEAFLGAIAWFTDTDIISALRDKKIGIVVQKEDFLRPESKVSKVALRRAYSSVPDTLTRYELPGVANSLSVCGSPEVEPFRCVGNHNRNKEAAMPRMHNKFLIGCDYVKFPDRNSSVEPRAVWTGSYNFTFNAQASFENALIIEDSTLALAFAKEWAQIYALSEPLDWASEWVAPQYRIGT